MTKPISLACVSVIRGLLPLPDEHLDEWLECAATDYEGVSIFDRNLLRLAGCVVAQRGGAKRRILSGASFFCFLRPFDRGGDHLGLRSALYLPAPN